VQYNYAIDFSTARYTDRGLLNEEKIIAQAQKCLEANPVIILGSGASAAHGVSGMPALSDHLITEVSPSTEHLDNWSDFKSSLERFGDLERALQDSQLSEPLLQDVVGKTRALILRDDLAVYDRLIQNHNELPLSRLYRHLFSSVRLASH